MKSGLDLQTAVELARQAELVKSQSTEQESLQTKQIDEVQRRRYCRRGDWNKRHSLSPQQQQQLLCGRCNREHAKESQCPARGKKCRKCGKLGHFATVCRTKTMQRKAVGEVLRKLDDDVQEWDETFFLGLVMSSNREKDPWQVELELNGKLTKFKIDTGADITVILEAVYNSLVPRPPLQLTTAVLCSPGGTVTCIGEISVVLSYKSVNYSVRIFVVRGEDVNCLLGREHSCQMGLVKRVREITDHNVFGDIGLLKCEPVKIQLKDNAKPYSVNTKAYTISPIAPSRS